MMNVTITRAKKYKPRPIRAESARRKPSASPDTLWDRIAAKAYELWEQHGRREGHVLRDRLDAEVMVMEEIHEARE